MSEGIFGLIGVAIGVIATVIQGWLSGHRSRAENARYLAIRVVCLLDKYVDDCAAAALDDGLNFGQRTEEGFLKPQAKLPEPIAFPEDVEWRSINHELMYEILSLPSEGERAVGAVRFTWDIAGPPDFDEYFEEAAIQLSKVGLKAAALAQKLREKYAIPALSLGDWNPVPRMQEESKRVAALLEQRAAAMKTLMQEAR